MTAIDKIESLLNEQEKLNRVEEYVMATAIVGGWFSLDLPVVINYDGLKMDFNEVLDEYERIGINTFCVVDDLDSLNCISDVAFLRDYTIVNKIKAMDGLVHEMVLHAFVFNKEVSTY